MQPARFSTRALPLALLALCSSVRAENHTLTLSEADFYTALPVVLSASRLSQPINESPASITVLDRYLIEASGARSIADLFRLVPGFSVGEPISGTQVLTYHGFGEELQRRLQVLIDGRSVYIPLSGGVPWANLPLSIEDIERIEVVRGPNAAVFGPNAFSAVINITTRHAAEDRGYYISAEHGGEDDDRVMLRGSWHADRLNMRVSLEGRDSDGYRAKPDRSNITMLSSRVDYSLSATDTLSAQLGGSETRDMVGYPDDLGDPLREREVYNHFAQVRWERNHGADDSLSVQLYHNAAGWRDGFHSDIDSVFVVREILDDTLDRARSIGSNDTVKDLLRQADDLLKQASSLDDLLNIFGLITQAQALNSDAGVAAWIDEALYYMQLLPGLLAIDPSERNAGMDFNGDVDSQRTELEIQRTTRLSDALRVVYGGSLRRDQVEAPGYMYERGVTTNDVYRLFSQGEWRFAEDFLLNAGAMVEHNNITDTDVSPRVALLYRQSPSNVWRISYSRATRTPTLFEAFANWRFNLSVPDGFVPYDGEDTVSFFQRQTVNSLNPETMTAWELGYNFRLPQYNSRVDIKLYHEEIDRLIDTGHGAVLEEDDVNQVTTTYLNRDGARTVGIEIEGSIRPVPSTLLRTTYAYADVKVDGLGTNDELSVPKRIFSAMWVYQPTPKDTLSAEYYHISDMIWMDAHDEIRINRLDLRFAHAFDFYGSDATFAVQVENLLDGHSDYYNDNRRHPNFFARLSFETL